MICTGWPVRPSRSQRLKFCERPVSTGLAPWPAPGRVAERRVGDVAQRHHGNVLAALGEDLRLDVVDELLRRLLHAPAMAAVCAAKSCRLAWSARDRAGCGVGLDLRRGGAEGAELREDVVAAGVDEDEVAAT